MNPYNEIVKLHLSGEAEDKQLAFDWLAQLHGKENAEATLFELAFFMDNDSDNDKIIDEQNYFKLDFTTFPIYFGKDYMYDIGFKARFKGDFIVDERHEYSRYKVGRGDHLYDFENKVCRVLRARGLELIQDIFTNIPAKIES